MLYLSFSTSRIGLQRTTCVQSTGLSKALIVQLEIY